MILAKLQCFHWITRTVSNLFSFVYMKIDSNFLFHALRYKWLSSHVYWCKKVYFLCWFFTFGRFPCLQSFTKALKKSLNASFCNYKLHPSSSKLSDEALTNLQAFCWDQNKNKSDEVNALSRKLERETPFRSFSNRKLRPLQSFSEPCKYEKQLQRR